MDILVTGGAGYIGSHVVYELIQQNYNVIILDSLATGKEQAINSRAKFYRGDICDPEILRTIFKNHKIKAVIHLAAKLLVGESVHKPLEYFSTNVGGTINLLKVMNEFNIKNLVFSSTAAVYGHPSSTISLSEDTIKVPINPYGSSKLASEQLIISSKVAYGINYVIFRYFNVGGANNLANLGQSVNKPLTHLIPTMINSIINQQQPLTVFGNDYETNDHTCIRDYVHVVDVAKAHILGLKYALTGESNIFNLGLNHGYSVKEVINQAEKIFNKPVNYQFGKRRAGDPPLLVAKTDKAVQILNFKPQYMLKDILASEMMWRKRHLF